MVLFPCVLNKIIPYGLFNEKIGDKKKYTEYQIKDWLLKKDINTISRKKENNFKLFNIFTFDAIHDNDIEECFNNLMETNNDDDKEYLNKINKFNDFYELGDSVNDDILNYVERKIKKFLSLDIIEINKCLEKYYKDKEFCNIGLSLNITTFIVNFLNMESKLTKNHDKKINNLSDRLSRYISLLIKKNIEISEYYEKRNCNGKISNNTKLLSNAHDKVFNTTHEYNLPDFGFIEIIENISENWIGKIILLLVFTYIFTQIISLFKINYNINPPSQ